MTRFAIIIDGAVSNFCEDVDPLDFPDLHLVDITGKSGIILGDLYDEGADTFNHPLPPEIDPAVAKENHNAPIRAALLALDMRAIRPLRDGETDRVADLAAQAAALRATLIA